MTLQDLDPEIAAAIGDLGFPDLNADNLQTLRSPFPTTEPPNTLTRTDRLVPGDREVPVRVHRPANVTGLLPCIYSIHGGGYVMGSYEMDDARFATWCAPSWGSWGYQ